MGAAAEGEHPFLGARLFLVTAGPADGGVVAAGVERLPLREGEQPVLRRVRFRTLGCYPLTGGFESDADTLEKIIAEMLVARTSERQGRMIDHDPTASMERKKREGYF